MTPEAERPGFNWLVGKARPNSQRDAPVSARGKSEALPQLLKSSFSSGSSRDSTPSDRSGESGHLSLS